MSETIINGIDVSECEQIVAQEKCALLDQEYCEDNPDCYFKQLKRLQEENEKLKANKGRYAFKCLDNTFCDGAKIKIDKLELDKDCLNASLETARKYRGIAETDRDKYKQALEEIREECFYECRVCGDCETDKECFEPCKKFQDSILSKINEVLNDRD